MSRGQLRVLLPLPVSALGNLHPRPSTVGSLSQLSTWYSHSWKCFVGFVPQSLTPSRGIKTTAAGPRVFKGKSPLHLLQMTLPTSLYRDLFSLGAKGTSSALPLGLSQGCWGARQQQQVFARRRGTAKSVKHTKGIRRHWS